MTYADEDEIDWSDGSFHTPPQKSIETTAHPLQSNPSAETYGGQGSLFVSDNRDQNQIPYSFPLEPGKKLGLNGSR